MAVVTFYTHSKDQAGNTSAAISLATYLGIAKNQRTLLISTSFNDDTIRNAYWEERSKKKSGLFGPNTTAMSDNGIEGLDRIIRSNKISPDIITDYTKVALKNRLEILFGYKGSIEQYKTIQKNYFQIVNLAAKYYDTVVIDIDKELDTKTKIEIINASDIVCAMTRQKIKNLEEILGLIAEGTVLRKNNTLITLGIYDDKSKYNAKNISRNLLRQRDIIDTVPYNTILFEVMQEGDIIDYFIKLLGLKGRDENKFFIDEIERLYEDINKRIKQIQQMMQ